MLLINYKPLDIICNKTNPIKIKVYIYSNDTSYIWLSTSLDLIANLPTVLEVKKGKIVEYTIVAYPKKYEKYFPLYFNLNSILIPVVYYTAKKTEVIKPKIIENFTVSVKIVDKKELDVCIKGKFRKVDYTIRIDNNEKTGEITFPMCLYYSLPQNPGLHTITITVKGQKEKFFKQLSYYIPPYFYYTIYYNITNNLLETDVKIVIKTHGNIPGKVSFCIPINPKMCINEVLPPNSQKVYEIKFNYTLYYAVGFIVGSSIVGLSHLYFSKKIGVKKEYKVKGKEIVVMLMLKNLTNRETKGIVLDPLPPGVEEVIPITEGVKIKEFAGQKFIVYYYSLKPGEEIVITYKLRFPFEPIDIKLPKPIVR